MFKLKPSFKKRRKPAEDIPPQSEAETPKLQGLPDENDFRTSLILPHLAARFDILKRDTPPSDSEKPLANLPNQPSYAMESPQDVSAGVEQKHIELSPETARYNQQLSAWVAEQRRNDAAKIPLFSNRSFRDREGISIVKNTEDSPETEPPSVDPKHSPEVLSNTSHRASEESRGTHENREENMPAMEILDNAEGPAPPPPLKDEPVPRPASDNAPKSRQASIEQSPTPGKASSPVPTVGLALPLDVVEQAAPNPVRTPLPTSSPSPPVPADKPVPSLPNTHKELPPLVAQAPSLYAGEKPDNISLPPSESSRGSLTSIETRSAGSGTLEPDHAPRPYSKPPMVPEKTPISPPISPPAKYAHAASPLPLSPKLPKSSTFPQNHLASEPKISPPQSMISSQPPSPIQPVFQLQPPPRPPPPPVSLLDRNFPHNQIFAENQASHLEKDSRFIFEKPLPRSNTAPTRKPAASFKQENEPRAPTPNGDLQERLRKIKKSVTKGILSSGHKPREELDSEKEDGRSDYSDTGSLSGKKKLFSKWTNGGNKQPPPKARAQTKTIGYDSSDDDPVISKAISKRFYSDENLRSRFTRDKAARNINAPVVARTVHAYAPSYTTISSSSSLRSMSPSREPLIIPEPSIDTTKHHGEITMAPTTSVPNSPATGAFHLARKDSLTLGNFNPAGNSKEHRVSQEKDMDLTPPTPPPKTADVNIDSDGHLLPQAKPEQAQDSIDKQRLSTPPPIPPRSHLRFHGQNSPPNSSTPNSESSPASLAPPLVTIEDHTGADAPSVVRKTVILMRPAPLTSSHREQASTETSQEMREQPETLVRYLNESNNGKEWENALAKLEGRQNSERNKNGERGAKGEQRREQEEAFRRKLKSIAATFEDADRVIVTEGNAGVEHVKMYEMSDGRLFWTAMDGNKTRASGMFNLVAAVPFGEDAEAEDGQEDAEDDINASGRRAREGRDSARLLRLIEKLSVEDGNPTPLATNGESREGERDPGLDEEEEAEEGWMLEEDGRHATEDIANFLLGKEQRSRSSFLSTLSEVSSRPASYMSTEGNTTSVYYAPEVTLPRLLEEMIRMQQEQQEQQEDRDFADIQWDNSEDRLDEIMKQLENQL
ncbi:uncharacterized protein VTP21DRAFT_6511 [Calcarisporiella thermophila]|uniref:uncharacterized protein n=1 Tax=Calcarisporiella thermophila TaxID=911321 RepID=UPI003743D20E